MLSHTHSRTSSQLRLLTVSSPDLVPGPEAPSYTKQVACSPFGGSGSLSASVVDRSSSQSDVGSGHLVQNIAGSHRLPVLSHAALSSAIIPWG